jgi:hypothetical protein
MNRALLTAIVALAALALFGASMAGATTVQKFSVTDLAKKSDTIALARVEDVSARWDDNHKEIYTFITLKVLDGVKGSRKDDVLTIRQLGGTVDKLISVVPGMPTFKQGEEVVVFLSPKDRAGYPWVMGLQQGKYSVSTDTNGFKQVWNDVQELKTVGPGGQPEEATAAAVQPLNSFLDGIRTELNVDGKVQIQPTE